MALRKDDILFLYTDGITELIDAKEEEFGEERLEGLVRGNPFLPSQELTDLIIDTACDYASAEAVDDQTVVVIKRRFTQDDTATGLV